MIDSTPHVPVHHGSPGVAPTGPEPGGIGVSHPPPTSLHPMERAISALGRLPAGRGGDSAAAALALLDTVSPELLVAAVQLEAREAQSALFGESVRGAEARTELAEMERQRAVEQARKAARKATKLLGLKKFLGRLVQVIAVAASVAASVASGGAAAGVAIAGAALVLGADLIAKGCEKMGLVDAEGGRRLALALRITGSLMSAGASAGAAVGAQAGSALLKSVRAGLEVARGASQVSDASVGMRLHGLDREHANRLGDAEEARSHRDWASQDVEALAQDFKDMLATLARVRAHMMGALEAQAEAGRAATGANT
jgi:hypothetical protein